MKIIGITGTNGSGKGTAADILRKKYPYIKYKSTREIIYDLAEKSGIMISNRDEIIDFANKYNLENKSFFQEFLLENKEDSKVYILESIRRVGEVQNIKSILGENFLLLAIDADPKIRFQRVSEIRKDKLDNISFQEFLDQEKKEQNKDNDKKQNISACIELADFLIKNDDDYNSFQEKLLEFEKKYESFLKV